MHSHFFRKENLFSDVKAAMIGKWKVGENQAIEKKYFDGPVKWKHSTSRSATDE